MSESPVHHSVLYEEAPHAAFVVDPSLKVVAVNAAGRRLIGLPASHPPAVALVDMLTASAGIRPDWPDLHSLILEVATSRSPLIRLIPSADLRESVPFAETVASTAPFQCTSGVWQVCISPILNAEQALDAIAVTLVAVAGVRITIAEPVAPVLQAAPEAPARAPALTAATRPALRGTPASMPGTDVSNDAGESRQDEGKGVHDDGVASVQRIHAGVDVPLRVLLVEDNLELRQITEEQLQILGHHVTSAPDAEQALRHLDGGNFDLLFTDLSLPKMTGAELARQVLQQHRPIRVVITSGYGRAMANAQNLNAFFLPKPYRFVDLEEMLAKIRRDQTSVE